jgi:hypothetical protein
MAFRCHQHTLGPKAARNASRYPHSTVSRRSVSLKAVRDKQAAPVVQELLQLVQGTERGLNTPAAVQDTILAKVAELKASHSVAETTTDPVLSATWKVSSTAGHGSCLEHTCVLQEMRNSITCNVSAI